MDQGLDQFKQPDKVNTRPLLKDLYKHITPQYATQWRVIGTLLDLSSETLNIIEYDNCYKAKPCCNAMLEKWLQVDTTASWAKLFTVIESSTVMSCSAPDKVTLPTPELYQFTITDKGAEAVATLSKRMSQINEQTRFMVNKNAWPPEQPASFTPLLLIYYEGHRTPEQVTAMAELMHAGDIGKAASVTKLGSHEKFQEVLAPLQKSKGSGFILVEGAPGIGKTVFLKEIAYRHATEQLLQNFKLVLLVYLRDPSLEYIKSVDDLLQLFCRGDKKTTEIVSSCSEYLFANGGKSLTFLLDGYDEYPEHLQESSLIADIIKRQVLPLCGLVVSSRPHASGDLRRQANVRVDILGFTETEREHYIKQALPDQPHKIAELTQYLHQQPSVDSICFIPFNMAILLYLYKLGISLPKNSTELYHHFICSTICRHLSKFGNPLIHNITDLTDLPEPYNRIIHQLSKLSLEAINSYKLVFTLDEIMAACPDIAVFPGAINGFGLLQAVQHFGLYAKMMTLNFIHFTVQEFLAAHYISHLAPNQELKVIEASFWNDRYFNTFTMYVSLTKGQGASFKTFLSGGNKAITISDKFLKDQLKCLRLYHCFNETDDHKMCDSIAQAEIFKGKTIKLSYTRLTASDVECISLFLTSSLNKQWERLCLDHCYIQDKGLNILYHRLCHSSDITINVLGLIGNGLTTHSSSMISELTMHCKVKELWINENPIIGEDHGHQLYSMLTNPSTILENLFMHRTSLSSSAAIALFNALKNNDKLKILDITHNDITDDASDTMTTVLMRNNSLVRLSICDNPLSWEAIHNIVQSLRNNNKLQLLGVPKFSDCRFTELLISPVREIVNKERENRGCQVKLWVEVGYI